MGHDKVLHADKVLDAMNKVSERMRFTGKIVYMSIQQFSKVVTIDGRLTQFIVQTELIIKEFFKGEFVCSMQTNGVQYGMDLSLEVDNLLGPSRSCGGMLVGCGTLGCFLCFPWWLSAGLGACAVVRFSFSHFAIGSPT